MKLSKFTIILKNLSLFKQFSENEILFILNSNQCRISDFKKESILYLQNQKCETFDIILEGKVLIQQIGEDGSILIVSEFNTGDTLGGSLLFADINAYPMTVVAKAHSKILHIPKALILKFCKTNENFLYEFIRLISNRTFILGTRLKNVTLKTIRQLVTEFLSYEYQKKNSSLIKLNMSKKEWAQKLGVQRPSLSRELAKMKKEGLIDYSLKTIEIKDIGRLINKD